MPDTTDAVECYGTAVYRLAYAAITVPPQPLPVKITGGHGYCG